MMDDGVGRIVGIEVDVEVGGRGSEVAVRVGSRGSGVDIAGDSWEPDAAQADNSSVTAIRNDFSSVCFIPVSPPKPFQWRDENSCLFYFNIP